MDTTETIVAESVLFPRIWDPGKPGFWTPKTRILDPGPDPQICQISARSRIWPELGPSLGIPENGQIPETQNPRNPRNPQNPGKVIITGFSTFSVL